MRVALDEELALEEREIARFLKEISRNNYEMQRELLKKETGKYEWYELE